MVENLVAVVERLVAAVEKLDAAIEKLVAVVEKFIRKTQPTFILQYVVFIIDIRFTLKT